MFHPSSARHLWPTASNWLASDFWHNDPLKVRIVLIHFVVMRLPDSVAVTHVPTIQELNLNPHNRLSNGWARVICAVWLFSISGLWLFLLLDSSGNYDLDQGPECPRAASQDQTAQSIHHLPSTLWSRPWIIPIHWFIYDLYFWKRLMAIVIWLLETSLMQDQFIEKLLKSVGNTTKTDKHTHTQNIQNEKCLMAKTLHDWHLEMFVIFFSKIFLQKLLMKSPRRWWRACRNGDWILRD